MDTWTWDASRDQITDFDSKVITEQFRNYHEICIETEETLKLRRV